MHQFFCCGVSKLFNVLRITGKNVSEVIKLIYCMVFDIEIEVGFDRARNMGRCSNWRVYGN